MRALISVYNKAGVAEFADFLSRGGWELISTGGTYVSLTDSGLKPLKLSDLISSPEMLGGRVKTLHPEVFASILARADQQGELESFGLKRFDLICCNLYPFEEAAEKVSDEETILENIDIGGVSLIRAAAKNYKNVITVTSPKDYEAVSRKLKEGTLDEGFRRGLALKAFKLTSAYDAAIRDFFSGSAGTHLVIDLEKTAGLRYGENPHQRAALFGETPYRLTAGEKELSYNNYQDMDAAVRLVRSFSAPAAAVIKHAVPCGAASAENIEEAFLSAHAADTVSAFGGIIGLNREVTGRLAEEIVKTFFEVVAAPSFTPEALEIFSVKPNLRLVACREAAAGPEYRTITGGILLQDPDSFEGEEWRVVAGKEPSAGEYADLEVAWKVSAFLKSNAVAIVKNGSTLGLGSGQTSRVDAVRIAVKGLSGVRDAVMASDGFFPFPDAVEEAAAAGVRTIVQPGGSKNDEMVIKAAERLGVSMVFTGRRHFLH